MLIDIDQQDDGSAEPERIIDPVINRYTRRIHLLTQEFIAETKQYELSREQIKQLTDILITVQGMLFFVEDLERLDAMLRISFPGEYYGSNANLVSMLTDYPLSTSN